MVYSQSRGRELPSGATLQRSIREWTKMAHTVQSPLQYIRLPHFALRRSERRLSMTTPEVATPLVRRQGTHVIAGHDIYGGTYRLFDNLLPRFGIEFSFVDMREQEAVRAALRPNTALIWIETPSNPLLNTVDIASTVEIAQEAGVLTAADNTFLSPYFQRPLNMGVDIVVHSTTKYLNGHSDVVGGALVTANRELGERLASVINTTGIACSPFDAWLVLRGIKTLGPRMEAHQRNAFAVAEFLQQHENVRRVYFPGLKNHPDHALANRQQSGFGGMVSMDLDTDVVAPTDFFSRLRYFAIAESLGGVESLAEHPWTMSHASMPEKARIRAGINESTVRLSLGIEDPADLMEDLELALERTKGKTA